MFFLIIMQKPKLIQMIYLCKKHLTLQNIIILIKSVLHKNQNHSYYDIFLEKYSYQLAKN